MLDNFELVAKTSMEYFFFEQPQDMPEALYSEEGTPFEHCKQCGKNLQYPPAAYTMEKVFKRYPNTPKPQVLFEYAVCDSCTDDIRNDFSEESKRSMQAYFAQNMQHAEDLEQRDLQKRLHTCLIKNTDLAEEQEYAVVARAHGNQMLFGQYPFAVGLTAMDEMAELLSDKTRDLLDDFVERNFTGPPEFEVVPPDGKWVLV